MEQIPISSSSEQLRRLSEENVELSKKIFRAHDDYLALQSRLNESEEAVRVLSVALGVVLLAALVVGVALLRSGGLK